ncbi:MAG: hypothetical protein ACKOT0_01905 [bacterium]
MDLPADGGRTFTCTRTNTFQPEISLTKTGDELSKVGDDVHYDIGIANVSETGAPSGTPDLQCRVVDEPIGFDETVTLAADDSAAFVDPLVSGVSLPAACDSLAVGDSCEVTYDYVVKADDSVIPNTVTVLFHPKGFPNDVSDTARAELTVIHPSFTVTKTCSTPDFPAGSTVIFTVDVVNTGDVPLNFTLDDSIAGNGNPAAVYPLTGANTTATVNSDVTNAQITFANGQASFVVGVGKRAQLEISLQTANVAVTNTIAARGDLPQDYRGTSYSQTLTARDTCVDAPEDGATRTIGFWRTHSSFTRQVLDQRPLPSVAVVGTSPLVVGSDGRFVNGYIKLSQSGKIFALKSVADVMGVFWANNSFNSNGRKRTTICQARIVMGKQLLGAILNQAFGNPRPLPMVDGMDLITAALKAMDGTDANAIRTIGTLLDEYNNSGDSTTIVIPGGLTIGKADPQAAQAIARLAAGDC